MAHKVKNLPVMEEAWVQSLDQEGSLKKKMATHSSILVWRIPWTEESGRLQSTGSQRVRHDQETNTHTHQVILSKLAISTARFPEAQAVQNQR